MSNQKKLGKRSKAKRWLRGWVFTPLGSVRIRLIKKLQRKRSRSISDSEFRRIIFDALTDRYPTRYFRERNGLPSSPVRLSLFSDEYNLSLVELVSPLTLGRKERGFSQPLRCRKRNGQPERVTLAVATVQPYVPLVDPRNSWPVDCDEPTELKVMNPDSYSGSISEDEQSLKLHLMASDAAPCVPDLYFVDRPDPPLACVITQALRDSNAFSGSQSFICRCSPSVHISRSFNHGLFSLKMSPSSNTYSALPNFAAKHLLNRACRKRNAFLMHRAKPSQPTIWSKSFSIRKNKRILREKIRDGPLPPLPIESDDSLTKSSPPNDLHHKLQHGALPPLPPPICTRPIRIASTTVSSYEPGTPSDVPPGGYRPSLCNNWPESQARCHALQTYPFGSSGPSSPRDVPSPPSCPDSPQEPTSVNMGISHLPISLRAGWASMNYTSRRDSANDQEHVDTGASGPRCDLPDTSPELELCLSAGKVARNRRRFDGW